MTLEELLFFHSSITHQLAFKSLLKMDIRSTCPTEYDFIVEIDPLKIPSLLIFTLNAGILLSVCLDSIFIIFARENVSMRFQTDEIFDQ